MPDSFDYTTGTNSENVRLLQALIDDAPEYTEETNSRNANILKSIINNTEYTDAPQSEIEELLLRLKAKIGGEIEVDELTVTENGTYDAGVNKAYNPVKVELPLDSKTITENGTYTASDDNLAGYDEVTVAVEGYAKKSIANTPTAIATFNASALPMPSLTVGIEATQDLHGYEYPWPAGGGINLLDVKNKVPSAEISHVTYVSDDNYIILNGTKSGGGYADLSSLTITLDVGTYYLKAFIISGTTSGTVELYPYDGLNNLTGTIIGNERVLTLTESKTFRFRFAIWTDGTVLTNYKIGIVVSKTANIDKFYPYSNECPIVGKSAVNVYDTGYNIWDEEWEVGGYSTQTGEKTTATNRIRSKALICVKEGETIYCHTNGYAMRLFLYDAKGDYITSPSAITDGTYTIPSGTSYITFHMGGEYGTTYNNDVSINYPSTDTSYHAYNGTTYNIDLDGTRYGCTLDVVNGELVVDRAYYKYTNVSTTSGIVVTNGWRCNFTCPIDDINRGKWSIQTDATPIFNKISTVAKGYGANEYTVILPNVTSKEEADAMLEGLEICYKLATPLTYQLTPTAVKSLLGTNNLWADSGDVQSGEYMEAL
jgi:hypothetical protein